jgi:hypothetical protein
LTYVAPLAPSNHLARFISRYILSLSSPRLICACEIDATADPSASTAISYGGRR